MVNLGNLTESKLIQNLVPVHKCGLVENIVQKGGHKINDYVPLPKRQKGTRNAYIAG